MVVALVDMRSASDAGRTADFAREINARVDLITTASGTVRLPEGVLEKGQELVARYEAAATGRQTSAAASGPVERFPAPPEQAGDAEADGSATP